MITRVDAGKAVGGNIGMGRLARRHALAMAFGAAVGIALLAGVAASQYFSAGSAPTAASAVSVTGGQQRHLAWLNTRDSAAAVPATSGDHQRQLALVEARGSGQGSFQATGPRQQGQLYQVHVRDNGGAPSPAGINHQQARLYATYVRDYGQGTTDGDSGPCHTPGRSCDR